METIENKLGKAKIKEARQYAKKTMSKLVETREKAAQKQTEVENQLQTSLNPESLAKNINEGLQNPTVLQAMAQILEAVGVPIYE